MKFIRISIVFVAWVLVSTAQPQDCSDAALQRTIDRVERELQPKMGAIRLHRVEDLEDEIFARSLPMAARR